MARPSAYNVKGIASHLGVSTATISRVINNHPGVSEERRCEILKLLRKETNGLSNTGRIVRILTIIEIQKPIVEGFLAGILSGIARYTLEHPISIELCFLPRTNRPPTLLKLLRDKRCEAIISVFPSEKTKRQLASLAQKDVPAVLVGEQSDAAKVGHVLADSFEGAIVAVDYLASLGHTKIGFLANSTEESPELRRRVEGYQAGIRKNGLVEDPRLIIPHRKTDITQEAGRLQTLTLLRQVPDVTAIFASTDEMAYGAIRACHEQGRAVPETVSVIGFDDYPGSRYGIPSLTTIDASLTELGFEAVKSLDQIVNALSAAGRKQVIECRLVIRESCMPTPKNNPRPLS